MRSPHQNQFINIYLIIDVVSTSVIDLKFKKSPPLKAHFSCCDSYYDHDMILNKFFDNK